VVPRTFPGENLPWASGVEVALDSLESLVQEHPHGPRYKREKPARTRERTPEADDTRNGRYAAEDTRGGRPPVADRAPRWEPDDARPTSSTSRISKPTGSGRTTPATRPGSGQSMRTDGTEARRDARPTRKSEPPLSRHEQAKRHREALAAEKKSGLEQRVQSKTRDHDAEIARIEQVLANAGSLSSASVAGMTKQLQTLRATKARAERAKQPERLPEREDEPTPAKTRTTHTQECATEATNEEAKARDLFADFLHRGRRARTWRANELRLLNAFIVPKEFPGERITWQRVELGLDELESLVEGQTTRAAPMAEALPTKGPAPQRFATDARYDQAPRAERSASERTPAKADRDGYDYRDTRGAPHDGGAYDARAYARDSTAYDSPVEARPRPAPVVYGAGTAPWGNAMNDPQSPLR